MRSLSSRIVHDQQRHLVISPWSLVAAVLMQSREGIVLSQLARETDWLKRQAANLGAYIDWPGEGDGLAETTGGEPGRVHRLAR